VEEGDGHGEGGERMPPREGDDRVETGLERMGRLERQLLGRFWRAVNTLKEGGFVKPSRKSEVLEKTFFNLCEYSE
jgi:hypothetical protein